MAKIWVKTAFFDIGLVPYVFIKRIVTYQNCFKKMIYNSKNSEKRNIWRSLHCGASSTTRYDMTLDTLVAALMASLSPILSLMFLIFLCLLIFALLGMSLFGGKLNYKV